MDTQTEDFTVVGIGDMSGDVFGNGMLLSEHIRLVAAFDHRHIFIDPTPDAATSYAERRRLFELPRSSWADYDTELLSAGGGIFPRTAKAIPINSHIRHALGIEDKVTKMTPADLMKAIPQGAGGPAVERRHRHVREVVRGVERGRRRQGQRRDPRRRQGSCASRSSARAATWA